MKGAPWFKFFPADFLGGVAELSSEERGSYITLLCVQWQTGSLPTEHDRLERLAGGKVSKAVLCKFVVGNDQRLRNERLESHREEATAKSRKATEAAGQRWHGEKDANAMQTHMRTHMRTHSERNADAYAEARGQRLEARVQNSDATNQSPQPNNTIPARKPRKVGVVYPEDFTLFWSAYPRKVGKDKALDAWNKAAHKPHVADIIAKVESYAQTAHWTKDGGQFIPHPATWLNQGRWADEVTKTTTELAF